MIALYYRIVNGIEEGMSSEEFTFKSTEHLYHRAFQLREKSWSYLNEKRNSCTKEEYQDQLNSSQNAKYLIEELNK